MPSQKYGTKPIRMRITSRTGSISLTRGAQIIHICPHAIARPHPAEKLQVFQRIVPTRSHQGYPSDHATMPPSLARKALSWFYWLCNLRLYSVQCKVAVFARHSPCQANTATIPGLSLPTSIHMIHIQSMYVIQQFFSGNGHSMEGEPLCTVCSWGKLVASLGDVPI